MVFECCAMNRQKSGEIDLFGGLRAQRELGIIYFFMARRARWRVGALASIMQTSHRSGQRALRASLDLKVEQGRARSCRESKQED